MSKVWDFLSGGNAKVVSNAVADFYFSSKDFLTTISVYYVNSSKEIDRANNLEYFQAIPQGKIKNLTDLILYELNAFAAPSGTPFNHTKEDFERKVQNILRQRNVPELYISGDSKNLILNIIKEPFEEINYIQPNKYTGGTAMFASWGLHIQQNSQDEGWRDVICIQSSHYAYPLNLCGVYLANLDLDILTEVSKMNVVRYHYYNYTAMILLELDELRIFSRDGKYDKNTDKIFNSIDPIEPVIVEKQIFLRDGRIIDENSGYSALRFLYGYKN